MKTCTACGVSKLPTDFYVKSKSTGKLHSQCKQCYSSKRKHFMEEHYRKYGDMYRQRARLRKARLKKQRQDQLYELLLGEKCEKCGISDIRVLDFDHIDVRTKKFGIARAVNDAYSWDVIAEEIKKCRILCANCHRIRTAEQFDWRKNGAVAE